MGFFYSDKQEDHMRRQNEFETLIGYEFKNPHLLQQALTHSSYANEKHMKKHSDAMSVWNF